MLKNIIEKTKDAIIKHTNNFGSDLVLTNTNDDRVLIDSREIHQKGFERCLREFMDALPPRQTIDEQAGYLLMQDKELLKKQGALLFHLIASYGQLPKDISPEYAEKILFGAAFKVKDINGDSALTLACSKIEDEKLERGIIKKIHFKLTNQNKFLRYVIGQLVDFGNADEVFLQNNEHHTAASILLFKNENPMVGKTIDKKGIDHRHILSIIFPEKKDLFHIRPTSKPRIKDDDLSDILRNSLSSLSDKQFMQYWAMTEDKLFYQARTTGGFHFCPNSQFHYNDEGYGAVHGMRKRISMTFTDVMEGEAESRRKTKYDLHKYIKSDQYQQFLDSQKLLTSPKEQQQNDGTPLLPNAAKNEPSNSIKDITVYQLEDKSKNHENGRG